MEETDGSREAAMLSRLLVLEREKRIRAERLVEAERQMLLQMKMSRTCTEEKEGGAARIPKSLSRSSSTASIQFPRTFSQDFSSSILGQLSGELKEVLGSGERCCNRTDQQALPTTHCLQLCGFPVSICVRCRRRRISYLFSSFAICVYIYI